MSYLREQRFVKVLTRNTINSAMNTYLDLSLPINEDATCRYDSLVPGDTVPWVTYQFKNLSGFCQLQPSSAPSTTTSALAWNFFSSSGKFTSFNNIDLASSIKYFNKATNTSGQKAELIGFKSFSLSKDIGYRLYDRNVSGALTNDQILTDGAFFILPIGENQ